MARALTPQDAHLLINLLVKEATGQDATIQAVNTSTFVSCGETLLSTGTENVLNALSIVLGRTFMAVRPYDAKFKIIDAIDTSLYGQRVRKISYYARESKSSGDWNTNLNGANLKNGEDNTALNTLDSGSTSATKSMWEKNNPVPLELNFSGSSVWEDSTSIFEDQLKCAFRDEASFIEFVSGIMTEKANDLESQKEAFNRAGLLNHMAGIYDLSASMPKSCVNLTTKYNTKFGTTKTTAELLSTDLDDFLKFFVSEIQIASDYLTERSANYHWTPTISGYTLLRHTPKEKQKLVLYNPLFTEAKAWVMPTLFNPQYLDLNNFEGINYWQNINDPMAIKVTPAIPNVSTPSAQTTGSQVSLSNVVGMLFDADALMTCYQLERSASTPLEARKNYRVVWWSYARNLINDFTENAILFYMDDSDLESNNVAKAKTSKKK